MIRSLAFALTLVVACSTPSVRDARPDAGPAADAGKDAAADAGKDAAADAGKDAAVESVKDAAVESGKDADAGARAPTCGSESLAPPGHGALIDAAAATTCSIHYSGTDECGCDGGVCQSGRHCIQVFVPMPPVGGDFGYLNRCFATCETSADCGPSEACLANVFGVLVCAAPACRADSDCTADSCGQCVPGTVHFHINDAVDPSASHCVYEGECGAGSCARCAPTLFGHTCGAP